MEDRSFEGNFGSGKFQCETVQDGINYGKEPHRKGPVLEGFQFDLEYFTELRTWSLLLGIFCKALFNT